QQQQQQLDCQDPAQVTQQVLIGSVHDDTGSSSVPTRRVDKKGKQNKELSRVADAGADCLDCQAGVTAASGGSEWQ
ncbi:hypothetical protein, partial [Cupriavidus pinatubonensis]|uniref:hypothetical protein n=1 Tax=Cupriavidus pinatubonensis TaxID=248026 RepID=UPI001C62C037